MFPRSDGRLSFCLRRPGRNLQNHRSMKKTFFGIAVLPIFLFLSGCGTAAYEKRLERWFVEAPVPARNSMRYWARKRPSRARSPARRSSLRIPKTMQLVDCNDPRRGKCPLFEIPGLKATYEGAVEDAEQEQTALLLVCRRDRSGGDIILPTRNWLNELRRKFPADAPDSSTEVNKNYSAETPEGRCRKVGRNPFQMPARIFLTTKDNPQNYPRHEGHLRVLMPRGKRRGGDADLSLSQQLRRSAGADFDSDWIKLVAGT